MTTAAAVRAAALLQDLVPGGGPLVLRDPLVEDESVWFLAAVDGALVRFSDCPVGCPRWKRRGAPGPDHFVTPHGAARHLYSAPDKAQPDLNREYVPHIAAWARAVYHYGYEAQRSRFSHYRTFSRDLINRRIGGSYETDVECYDEAGRLVVQIEAKKDAGQVQRLAGQMAQRRHLEALPTTTAKEIEYVLDLAPTYLWVVGPGSVDPARHVFAVTVIGNDATFDPLADLPAARG